MAVGETEDEREKANLTIIKDKVSGNFLSNVIIPLLAIV